MHGGRSERGCYCYSYYHFPNKVSLPPGRRPKAAPQASDGEPKEGRGAALLATATSLSFETQARKGSLGQGLSCSLTAEPGIQIPTDVECVTVTSCSLPHRLLSGWLQSPGAPGEEERRQAVRHAGTRKNSTPEPVPTQRALSDTSQVERGGLRGDLSDRQSRTTSQVPDI